MLLQRLQMLSVYWKPDGDNAVESIYEFAKPIGNVLCMLAIVLPLTLRRIEPDVLRINLLFFFS